MTEPAETDLEQSPCWRTIGVWGHQNPRCEKLEKLIHCRNCEVFYEAAKSSFKDRLNEHFSFEKSRELLQKLHEPARRGDLSAVPFRIGDCWFGITAERLDMIAAEGPIHSLPFRSNRILLGLVAVNGEPVSCINIADIVNIKLSTSNDPNIYKSAFRRFLVINVEKGRIAFRVDEVREVEHYFMEDIINEPEPDARMPKFVAHRVSAREHNVTINVLDEEALFFQIARELK